MDGAAAKRSRSHQVMRCEIIASVLIISLASSCFANSFITFQQHNASTPDIITTSDQDTIRWSAGWKSGAKILLVRARNTNETLRSVSLIFNCRVEPLSGRDVLLGFQFCFENVVPNKCEFLKPNRTTARIYLGKEKTEAILTFDKHHGGMVRIGNVPVKQSLNQLQFYCKTWNRFGSLTSNTVSVLDVRAKMKKKKRILGYKSIVHSSKGDLADYHAVEDAPDPSNPCLPCFLKCLDTQLGVKKDTYILLPLVRWQACLGDPQVSAKNESCVPVMNIDPKWRVVILPYEDEGYYGFGALFWTSAPKRVRETMQGRYLKCTVDGQTTRIYPHKWLEKAKIFLGESKHDFSRSHIHNVSIDLFDSPHTDFTYTPAFYGDSADIQLKWSLAGKPLTGQCVALTNGLLRCHGPFSDRDDGIYKLNATKFTESRSLNLTLKTDVGFPKMSHAMPSTFLIVDNGEATVKCLFERQTVVTSRINLLGHSINFRSQSTIDASIRSIGEKYKTQYAPWNKRFNRIDSRKGRLLEYRVSRMIYLDQYRRSSTHYIECLGRRGQYPITYRVLLKVLPHPVLILSRVTLKKRTISNRVTSPRQSEILCSVKNAEEITEQIFSVAKSAREKVVKIVWILQIGDSRYSLSEANERLDIQAKPASPNALKLIIDEFSSTVGSFELNITCATTLHYPEALKAPESKRVFFSTQRSVVLQIQAPKNVSSILDSSKTASPHMPLYYLLPAAVILLPVIVFVLVYWWKGVQEKKRNTDGLLNG